MRGGPSKGVWKTFPSVSVRPLEYFDNSNISEVISLAEKSLQKKIWVKDTFDETIEFSDYAKLKCCELQLKSP